VPSWGRRLLRHIFFCFASHDHLGTGQLVHRTAPALCLRDGMHPVHLFGYQAAPAALRASLRLLQVLLSAAVSRMEMGKRRTLIAFQAPCIDRDIKDVASRSRSNYSQCAANSVTTGARKRSKKAVRYVFSCFYFLPPGLPGIANYAIPTPKIYPHKLPTLNANAVAVLKYVTD